MVFSFSLFYSQDLVVKTNGEEIYVNVIELTPEDIVFSFIGKDSIIYNYPLSNIHKVEFKNGSVYVINDLIAVDSTETEDSNTNIYTSANFSNQELINLAINDARIYYNPYGAQLGTACTTLSCGCIGLTFAAIASGTSPGPKSLKMPEENSYTQNSIYRQHYTIEAKRIKNKKIWEMFGICMAINIAWSVVSLSYEQ